MNHAERENHDHVVPERHGNVLEIRLNRPEVRNALSTEMMRGVATAFDQVKEDRGIRAVLLTAAGVSFCAGGDVKRQQQDAGNRRAIDVRRRMMSVAFPMMRAVVSAEVPVVAAIQGHAYGAGFSLALGADLLIASERATFCQAFVKLGLIPDLGSTLLLPRVVGHHRAMHLMMSGEPISAEMAHDLGFVAQVVSHDDLRDAALLRAHELAGGPTVALGLMKQLVSADLISRLESAMQSEAAGQAFCVETDDHLEGITAFGERRSPVFRGT